MIHYKDQALTRVKNRRSFSSYSEEELFPFHDSLATDNANNVTLKIKNEVHEHEIFLFNEIFGNFNPINKLY
jgi:hypothetical protein